MTELGPKDFFESQPMDRAALALGLQRAGVNVSGCELNDLSDEDIRDLSRYFGIGVDPITNQDLIHDTVLQQGVIAAMFSGDESLLGRDYVSDLFGDMMSGRILTFTGDEQ